MNMSPPLFHRLGSNKNVTFDLTPNGEMIMSPRSFHRLGSNKNVAFDLTPNGEMSYRPIILIKNYSQELTFNTST